MLEKIPLYISIYVQEVFIITRSLEGNVLMPEDQTDNVSKFKSETARNINYLSERVYMSYYTIIPMLAHEINIHVGAGKLRKKIDFF